jgi:hypothetical protein
MMDSVDTHKSGGSKTMKGMVWCLLFFAGCGGSSAAGPNPASGANVFFLRFEGQTLTPGVDDPVTNTSSLLSNSVTFPAYLAADAQRATKIQAIVHEVEAILAPYDIAVVTTRPASGAYDMLVAGGTSQAAGFPAGVPGVAVVDCTAARPRYISLLFDVSTGHDAARQIIGALGVSHGISASTKSTDCMCIADAGCTALAAACTMGGAGTPVSSNISCETAGVTTINVQQKFLTKFGAHP